MSKRILYTATSDIHLKAFHFPYLRWFQNHGYEVHLAIENRGNIDLSFCDQVFYVPFKRSPLNFKNYQAFKKLSEIINHFDYSLIHCHTPSASAITRLSSMKKFKKGTPVLYTSHGFHFSEEAPFYNWFLYYPVEKILSRYSSGIVTINTEDYQIARDRIGNPNIYQISGIGIDTEKFNKVLSFNKSELRRKYTISQSDFILLYVADFIPRKNHSFLLNALLILKENLPSLKLSLVGTGIDLDKMKSKATYMGLNEHVEFLGWREDVNYLARIADVGVSSSKLEGLGLGLAETMFCGAPIVASKTKGHKELVKHGENGFLFDLKDDKEFCDYVMYLYNNDHVRERMGEKSQEKAHDFRLENSIMQMGKIYKTYLNHK